SSSSSPSPSSSVAATAKEAEKSCNNLNVTPCKPATPPYNENGSVHAPRGYNYTPATPSGDNKPYHQYQHHPQNIRTEHYHHNNPVEESTLPGGYPHPGFPGPPLPPSPCNNNNNNNNNNMPGLNCGLSAIFANCNINSIGSVSHYVGNNNTFNIGAPTFPRRTQPSPSKDIGKYLRSNIELNEADLNLVAPKIGRQWRHVGRFLGIEDVQLETIEADNPRDAVEQAFQTLNKWRQRCDHRHSTVGQLTDALDKAKCYDAIHTLPLQR
ncbi:uncharacterized protein LOC115224810 isoform X3, partial [Argonauta hians]